MLTRALPTGRLARAALVAVAAAATAAVGLSTHEDAASASGLGTALSKPPKGAGRPAHVVDVIDGATLVVRDDVTKRRSTVTLLGVDVPDSAKPGVPVECGGLAARGYLLHLVLPSSSDEDQDGFLDTPNGSGRAVTVVRDPSQGRRSKAAYVYRKAGGELNRSQLLAGWGRSVAGRHKPAQLKAFRAAEQRARKAGAGVWGNCAGNFHVAGDVVY